MCWLLAFAPGVLLSKSSVARAVSTLPGSSTVVGTGRRECPGALQRAARSGRCAAWQKSIPRLESSTSANALGEVRRRRPGAQSAQLGKPLTCARLRELCRDVTSERPGTCAFPPHMGVAHAARLCGRSVTPPCHHGRRPAKSQKGFPGPMPRRAEWLRGRRLWPACIRDGQVWCRGVDGFPPQRRWGQLGNASVKLETAGRRSPRSWVFVECRGTVVAPGVQARLARVSIPDVVPGASMSARARVNPATNTTIPVHHRT